MGRDSLRALVAGLVQQINTLIIGATVEELHDILAALASTQSHAIAQLLAAKDMEVAARQNPEYLTARQTAKLTGFSRTWLYDNGERLGIAVRPRGVRGIRFLRAAVQGWLETRPSEQDLR